MFGLTQEQLMGIGGLLGGAGQGISQGGWRGAFGGAQQGLLNAQQMMQAQEMMKLRKAAAAMQQQEFAQKQAEVARQSQMRNTAEMQLTGDIGAGMLGDIPRAPGMPQPGGLLGQTNATPAVRAAAMINPIEGIQMMAQSEMSGEAERRKLLAGRDEKVWENENLKIPAEQRAATQAAQQAQMQSNLTASRERSLMRERFNMDLAKPTDAMREAIGIGLAPGTPEFVDYVTKARTKAGVNIDMAGEREETKKRAGMLTDEAKRVREAAEGAQAQIGNLRFAMAIPVKGGATEPFKVSVGAVAKSLGIPQETLDAMGIQNIANAQQYNGIMQNLVLTKMQAQKGPQTENDAKRIEMTVANLRNDDEARQFLMKAAMALNERDVEKASFYENHYAKKGTYSGAAEAWNGYAKDTPLFGFNPQSQRVVFYEDFMKAMQKANPEASQAEILDEWKQKYNAAPR